MLRLPGAEAYVTADHIIVKFGGYTGIFYVGRSEADIYRAIESAFVEDDRQTRLRAARTERAREARNLPANDRAMGKSAGN